MKKRIMCASSLNLDALKNMPQYIKFYAYDATGKDVTTDRLDFPADVEDIKRVVFNLFDSDPDVYAVETFIIVGDGRRVEEEHLSSTFTRDYIERYRKSDFDVVESAKSIKCVSSRKFSQAKATVPADRADSFKKFLDSIGVDYTTEEVDNGVEFLYGIYVGSKESKRIEKYLDKITSNIRGGTMKNRKFVIRASMSPEKFYTRDFPDVKPGQVKVAPQRGNYTVFIGLSDGTIAYQWCESKFTAQHEAEYARAIIKKYGSDDSYWISQGYKVWNPKANASTSAKRRFTVTASKKAVRAASVKRKAIQAAKIEDWGDGPVKVFWKSGKWSIIMDGYGLGITDGWGVERPIIYTHKDPPTVAYDGTAVSVPPYVKRKFEELVRKGVLKNRSDLYESGEWDTYFNASTSSSKKSVKASAKSDTIKSGVESSESAKRRFTVTAASRTSKPTATEFDTPVSVDIIFDETGDVISSFDDVIRIDEVGNRFYTYHDTKIGRNGQWEHSWVTSQFSYDVKDGSVESAKSIKCSEEEEGFHLYGYDADGADVTTGYSDSEMGIEDEIGNLFADESVDTVDIYENGISGYGDYIGTITRAEYDSDSTGRLLELLGTRDAAVESSNDIKCGYDLGADTADDTYTVDSFFGYNGDPFRGLADGITTDYWSEVESWSHEHLLKGENVKIDGPQGVLEITADEYNQAWEDGAADFDINDEIVEYKRRIVESSTDITASRRDTTIDKEAVRELVLYITNDGDLYRQRATPMIENLKRKAKKGVYDREKAVKLWQYLADEGVKKYGKEFGPGASVAWLNPATREEIARELRDHYEEEVMWEDSPVEASSYMIVPDSGTVPFDSEVIDILAYYGYSTLEDFAIANGIRDFVKAKQILLERYAEDTESGYPSSLWDGKSENEIYADLPEAGFIDDDTPYL